jgi:hypothetical protein
MVYIDHSDAGLSTNEFAALLKSAGVIVSTRPPRHIRMCTNLHHDDATIDEIVLRVRQVLHSTSQLA